MPTEDRANTVCVGAMPEMAIPTPLNAVRDIVVRKALNGFIVVCGCQTVVFEDKTKMLLEIGRYLDNPAQVEKEYLSKK